MSGEPGNLPPVAGVLSTQSFQHACWNAAPEPVAVSGGVQQLAHEELGHGVLATDLAHELRALLGGQAIHASSVHPIFLARYVAVD